jgi:hypothetical protein
MELQMRAGMLVWDGASIFDMPSYFQRCAWLPDSKQPITAEPDVSNGIG